ncbi:MAG: SprB repeat-containing protein [Bacteroidales bacterium]|nr:SprB repeat-containing protein [Bacteroidales bacterium]
MLLVACCWLLGSFILKGQVCSITAAHTDVVCFGDFTGTINITVSGGAEPYGFTWTGPGSFANTNQNLAGLGAGSYTVTAIGSAGSCTGTATIVIGQPEYPMEIISQPLDQTDCYGNTVEFPVEVNGSVGLVSYQWQSRPPEGEFSDIPGEVSPDLVVHDIGVNGENIHGTEYRLVASDDCITLTSEPALLGINAVTGLSGSVNLTICSGSGTSYEVSTRGNVTGYQWSFYDGTGWVNITDGSTYSGTTSQLLTISDATPAQTGGYRVSVTFTTLNQPDGYPECVVTTHTRNRNLMVLPPLVPPVVSSDQTFCDIGTPYPLTATPASGGSGPDYSYQWQFSTDGVTWTDIPGAMSLSYSPPLLTVTTMYRIMATDEGPLNCGTVFSFPVTIIVNPLPVTSAIYHN